jgi:hypothetical protein
LPEYDATPGSVIARELIGNALAVMGSTRGFEIVYVPHHGFDIVRRGKTEIEARISPEGLVLTVLDSAKKPTTVTDANTMWNFIEGHIRSLVPTAQFEGEAEG